MHYCIVVFFKMSLKSNRFLHYRRMNVIGLKVMSVEHTDETVQLEKPCPNSSDRTKQAYVLQ